MSYTTGVFSANMHAQLSPRGSTFTYGRSSTGLAGGPEFEIERSPRSPHGHIRSASRQPSRQPTPDLDVERALQAGVDALLRSKARPCAVAGTFPVTAYPALFFRSKGGTAHSLDFPIDIEYEHPPALDVLIAACKPLTTNDYPDRGCLVYPSTLPLALTVDLSTHPIPDAVRTTLLPALPMGHHLVAAQERLEVLTAGGHVAPQPSYLRNDGRVATIVIILPVHFRGGTLIVRDTDGVEERFIGKGGKGTQLEWAAFLADCDYEVEPVQSGCRLTVTYAIFSKSFGPSGITEPLITPGDDFLDTVAPILNLARGRKIAFYLAHDYGVDPSENLAEALVPQLKGGDALLYHALKLYKLNPELSWAAGGYIWPNNRVVECGSDPVDTPTHARRPPVSTFRGQLNAYPNPTDAEVESLRWRVEGSGAVPLASSGIQILTDWNGMAPVGKERVPFVSSGELEKLIVNVLMVAYVP